MAVQYLVSGEEMKRYDNFTIEQIGIPSLVLMERAALAVVQSMKTHYGNLIDKKILVVCGGGNNGGDGLAIARLLLDNGCDVEVALVALEETCTEQTKKQLMIIKSYLGEKIYKSEGKKLPIFPNKEYAIIIDALFGVGLSRPVTGEYANWIQAMNDAKAYIVSVDIPSGIDADWGRCMGCAVKADLTVTFAFPKRGLFLFPGKEYAGEVDCRDIGITERSFENHAPVCFTYNNAEDDKVRAVLPERALNGNKGTFGKLLILAGSRDLCGAGILCAKSAYRTGVGMVKIITPEVNRQIIQTTFPEAMLLTYESVPNNGIRQEEQENSFLLQELRKSFAWADGIVIGPGMGMEKEAGALVKLVLTEAACSLILDADALNLLAKDLEMQTLLRKRKERFTGSWTILTPHPGELARLTGKSIAEIKEHPLAHAKKLAERLHCIIVSKDATTIVCDEYEKFYLNTCGNSGMATAGCGDVLAGMLGSFLVQKQEGCNSMLDWISKGVYLHSYAGDLAKERVGEHAMIATDIIESLKEISKEG